MYKLVPLTSTLTKKFQKDLNLCESKDKKEMKDKILKKKNSTVQTRAAILIT